MNRKSSLIFFYYLCKYMELRQLRYFIKAAETHNFSEAAKLMFVTQSTLSQQIKQLEDELGVQLFHRNSHDVSLTDEGMQLLPFARETVSSADNCVEQMNGLKNLLTGTLYIGVTYSFSPILTETMLDFCRRYPKVKLQVVYKTMEELIQMLQHRELDFVLAYKPIEEYAKIESKVLFRNPLSVIVREDHPLAKLEKASITDLEHYDMAMPARGTQPRQILDFILGNDLESRFNVRMDLNDLNILLRVVQKSNYFSILSESSVQDVDGLKAVPLDIENNMMEGCIHTLKGVYTKNSANEFCRILKESAAIKKYNLGL